MTFGAANTEILYFTFVGTVADLDAVKRMYNSTGSSGTRICSLTCANVVSSVGELVQLDTDDVLVDPSETDLGK